jgi:hypothetical protein
MIDPDAPRNQRADEFLRDALQVLGASADTLYVESIL